MVQDLGAVLFVAYGRRGRRKAAAYADEGIRRDSFERYGVGDRDL